MRRVLLGMVAAGLGFTPAMLVALAPPAHAACHAFEVEASPDDTGEGTTIEVTVSRDAAVNPSSVRVRTVDATARAGEDYEAVDRRIAFTAEIEQTFTLQVLDDGADEPDEEFQIVLSEGDGCPVNPNFSYDEATVRIRDDDEPATTTTPTTARATSTSEATTSTTTATTATTEATDTTDTTDTTAPTSTLPGEDGLDEEDGTSTTSEPGDELATDLVDDDDGGNTAAAVIAGLLAVAAVAGAGYAVYRFRGARPG